MDISLDVLKKLKIVAYGTVTPPAGATAPAEAPPSAGALPPPLPTPSAPDGAES